MANKYDDKAIGADTDTAAKTTALTGTLHADQTQQVTSGLSSVSAK